MSVYPALYTQRREIHDGEISSDIIAEFTMNGPSR
jgi:hypothetical protein